MLVTKTMHPPAGANLFIMIHEHAGFFGLWQPVGLGIIILALVAVVWSRLWPGMNHYPTNWSEKSPPSILWGGLGKYRFTACIVISAWRLLGAGTIIKLRSADNPTEKIRMAFSGPARVQRLKWAFANISQPLNPSLDFCRVNR